MGFGRAVRHGGLIVPLEKFGFGLGRRDMAERLSHVSSTVLRRVAASLERVAGIMRRRADEADE
jgi:hypothetical protein